ncbi:hypothetical protein [Phreatobacter sp.]|uniref:hypothetical protein n=1 Tax=Phreatobacter sp. TaxID=1966341 RepID=UPI003F71CE02
MSLLPSRRTVHSVHRDAISGASADGGRSRRPFRLLQRLILFLVAAIIFHGVSLFAVTQIVRVHPELMTSNPVVGELLCGQGMKLRLDFSPPDAGRRRGLAAWIDCVDAQGFIDRDAGTLAAILSGLVLTIPFAVIMLGIVLRMKRGPHERAFMLVMTAPEPMDWFTRLAFCVVVLGIAAIIAGAVSGYITQYRPALVLEHPATIRLACGENLKPRVVFPYSRSRRLGCFTQTGHEDHAVSRFAMLRLLAPLYLLIVVPGIWLVFRIRTMRRTRAVPMKD